MTNKIYTREDAVSRFDKKEWELAAYYKQRGMDYAYDRMIENMLIFLQTRKSVLQRIFEGSL